MLCFRILNPANSNVVRLNSALDSVALEQLMLGLCGLGVSLDCLDSVPGCHVFSML